MSIQEAKTSDFTLEKSEVLPLTPEFAEQFRDMEPSPTERPLNPSRVEHLREKALAGLLVPFTWSVAKFGDKMVRMNGQHSSTMLCALNGAFPKDGKVHLDTYRAESPEGIALLFRQCDDRKSGRTPSDVAAAYQGIHSELKEVPRPTAKLAAEGINWYHRYVEGVPSLSGDDIYNIFGDCQSVPIRALAWRVVHDQDAGIEASADRGSDVWHVRQERDGGPQVLGRRGTRWD